MNITLIVQGLKSLKYLFRDELKFVPVQSLFLRALFHISIKILKHNRRRLGWLLDLIH